MATAKKPAAKKSADDPETPVKVDPDEHVVRTATHTITRTEQGQLISCVENESGDEVDVPLELRHLTN